jgi:flagellar biosynthetic protein FliP
MLFADMAKEAEAAKPEDLSLRVLVPAFMISELQRAFEIGFLLFLPFLIIDLVVARRGIAAVQANLFRAG